MKQTKFWTLLSLTGLMMIAGCSNATSSTAPSASSTSAPTSSVAESSVTASSVESSKEAPVESSTSAAKQVTLKESKNYSVYVLDPTKADTTIDIAYFTDYSSIGYVAISDAMTLYKLIRGYNGIYDDPDWNCEVSALNGSSLVITNTYSKDTLTIDSDKDTFVYSYYGGFFTENGNIPNTPVSSYGILGDSTSTNIKYIAYEAENGIVNANFVMRHSDETTFDLSKYNIDVLAYNNTIYLPFATFNDMFLSFIGCPLSILTDGIYGVDNMTKQADAIANKGVEATPELLQFNYDELCFNFDTFYGFPEKADHDFNTYFIRNGLKDKFLTSSMDADQALCTVLTTLMDDGHTNYLASSPNNFSFTGYYGNEAKKMITDVAYFSGLRTMSYPTGFNAYEEFGETAIITFDSFDAAPADLYEKGVPATLEEASTNAFALFTYAYKQITRENSPITQIVVDITNNGGGDARCCAYVGAMLLGGSCCFYSRNTITGDVTTCTVVADSNLDGKFDTSDSLLGGRSAYILTSPGSFSCGNILPSLMKQKSNCFVVGQRSSGGSNVVAMSSTALGTAYRMSGTTQMCQYVNSNYVNIDDGIEVDKEVLPNHFYTNNRADLLSDLFD